MRNASLFILATIMAVDFGLVTIQSAGAQQRRADDESNERQRQQQQAQPQLPNGFQLKDLGQIDNIRSKLAEVVQDAFTRDDFGKVIDNLAVQNRERMKDYKNQDFTTLNGIIAQIDKQWNQKYGHRFNIKRADNVFTDQITIVQGVVTDATVAAANFPVPPTPEMRNGARLAGNREQARNRDEARNREQQAERNANTGQAQDVEAKDLQDSKGVALVQFPPEVGLPAVTVSMVEEGLIGKWRIAVPNELTSQQLHTQLQNELTYFSRGADQWPSDEAAAYRAAAQRVMLALYNVNPPEAERAQQ